MSSSSLSSVPNPIREAPSLRLFCQARFLLRQIKLCKPTHTFACASSSLFHREQTLARMLEGNGVLVCLLVSLFSLWLSPSLLPGIFGTRPGPHCLSGSDTHLSKSGNPPAAVTAHSPAGFYLHDIREEKTLAAPLSRSAAAVKPRM